MAREARRVLVIGDPHPGTDAVVAALHESPLDLEIHCASNPYQGCIVCSDFGPELVVLEPLAYGPHGREIVEAFRRSPVQSPRLLGLGAASAVPTDPARAGCDAWVSLPLQAAELQESVCRLLEPRRATRPWEAPALRVLWVHERTADAATIAALASGRAGRRSDIVQVPSFEDALRQLGARAFDLVVLDGPPRTDPTLSTLIRARALCGEAPILLIGEAPPAEGTGGLQHATGVDVQLHPRADPAELALLVTQTAERRGGTAGFGRAGKRESYLATHDGLTGLPNRARFYEELQQALSYATRYEKQVSVLTVDLDEFHRVNDGLGHAVGDHVLHAVSRRLLAAIRRSDTAARLGGDEFVLLLHNLTQAEDAARIAQHVLAELAQPYRLAGHEVQLSAGIGIALFPQDGPDADALVRCSSAALASAKKRGRNEYQFCTTELNVKCRERRTFERGLRRALEHDEFVVHYQPQLDARSGEIFGVEALVRWNHPELGLIHPAQFIRQAEELGLIGPIAEWVLDAACAQHRDWRDAGLPPIRLAVNLSRDQLRHRHLPGKVRDTIERTGIEPAQLELEITETGMLDDNARCLATLNALKALGVRISIDDFGTGQASLAYLRRFPADTLKLDRSYVRHLASDAGDQAIAAAILTMAKTLHLETIAEGVETHQQLDFLLGYDCSRVQGFLFSRALPPDAFTVLWRRGPLTQTGCDLPA